MTAVSAKIQHEGLGMATAAVEKKRTFDVCKGVAKVNLSWSSATH